VIHREWFLRRADRAKERMGLWTSALFLNIEPRSGEIEKRRAISIALLFEDEPRRGEWRKIVHNFSTTTLLKKAELKEIGRESYFLNMS
jgi:hypothetical protein